MREDPFTVDVDVRFRDIDAMGHVNNAVYATYLEHGRVEYYREVLGLSLANIGTVLVHLELDYRRPIELGETATVAIEVSELGESSITMRYEVRSGGAIAATGETVQVAWDGESETSKPIPPAWRSGIEEYEGL